MNVNKVIIVGNLTRDPEMRVTPTGTALASATIAINRKYQDAGGQTREEVVFVDLEAWQKIAENIVKYFKKGSGIFVEGALKLDQWEDKITKEKRSRMKVTVNNFQFVGSKQDSEQDNNPPAGSEFRSPSPRTQRAPVAQENLDEDVPF